MSQGAWKRGYLDGEQRLCPTALDLKAREVEINRLYFPDFGIYDSISEKNNWQVTQVASFIKEKEFQHQEK